MPKTRVLVTGAGGVAGVNFVRALRASEAGYWIAGTDYDKYYIEIPDLDIRHLTPRHDSSDFVRKVADLAKKEMVDFLHPQPSAEALVLAKARDQIAVPMLLPRPEVMEIGQDKLLTKVRIEQAGIPVAGTMPLEELDDVDEAFSTFQVPLWVRARHGAGGRFSLSCKSKEEALHWIAIWTGRGTPLDEFIIQEYLPGRNIAMDTIWFDGKLVTSYCRERIEYPFKHVSPSGITGTPSVARIVRDRRVNEVGEKSVEALDPRPNGAYSIDIKEDARGRPCVTEVDAGKFHTTMPLWGYVAVRHLHLPWYANLADLYVRLGLGEDPPDDVPPKDLLPEGYYMIRNIDSGVLLWREDGWKERVL
jgi:glutathione synthase/RimK-type ligase-like ATP-grasp enzyme